MDTNDKLLQELGLLREAIERIADALEGIDDKLEDMIEVEEFDQSKLNQLLLGYAISVHKSQGSTTDYSINIVSNAHKKMLTRGLLYVATTRCKKAHIDIGDINAFKYALTVDDNDLRQTWLLDLLTKNA